MPRYNVKVEYVSVYKGLDWYTVEADDTEKAGAEAIRRLYRDVNDDFTDVVRIDNVEIIEKPHDKYYYVEVSIVHLDSKDTEYCSYYFDFYTAKRHITTDEYFDKKVQKEIEQRADIYAKLHHISNYKVKNVKIEEVSDEEYSYSLSCTI